MQSTFVVFAFFYALLASTFSAVQAAPLATTVLSAPLPQTSDCGVAGGQSCNVESFVPALDTIVPRTPSPQTSDCGVAGGQSCNVESFEPVTPSAISADGVLDTSCGVAGGQSCNVGQ